jgi:hypothetical protein
MVTTLFLLALAAASDAPSEEPRVEYSYRKGLLIPGAIILGASYTTAAGLAVLLEDGILAIPIVGPFAVLARHPEQRAAEGNSLLLIGGLLQVGGAIVTILGLVLRREEIVEYEEEYVIAPLLGGDSGGLALSARF